MYKFTTINAKSQYLDAESNIHFSDDKNEFIDNIMSKVQNIPDNDKQYIREQYNVFAEQFKNLLCLQQTNQQPSTLEQFIIDDNYMVVDTLNLSANDKTIQYLYENEYQQQNRIVPVKKVLELIQHYYNEVFNKKITYIIIHRSFRNYINFYEYSFGYKRYKIIEVYVGGQQFVNIMNLGIGYMSEMDDLAVVSIYQILKDMKKNCAMITNDKYDWTRVRNSINFYNTVTLHGKEIYDTQVKEWKIIEHNIHKTAKEMRDIRMRLQNLKKFQELLYELNGPEWIDSYIKDNIKQKQYAIKDYDTKTLEYDLKKISNILEYDIMDKTLVQIAQQILTDLSTKEDDMIQKIRKYDKTSQTLESLLKQDPLIPSRPRIQKEDPLQEKEYKIPRIQKEDPLQKKEYKIPRIQKQDTLTPSKRKSETQHEQQEGYKIPKIQKVTIDQVEQELKSKNITNAQNKYRQLIEYPNSNPNDPVIKELGIRIGLKYIYSNIKKKQFNELKQQFDELKSKWNNIQEQDKQRLKNKNTVPDLLNKLQKYFTFLQLKQKIKKADNQKQYDELETKWNKIKTQYDNIAIKTMNQALSDAQNSIKK